MSHAHLTEEERDTLANCLANNWSKNRIAEHLGRHRSTIYREVKRNAPGGDYRAIAAQAKATARQRGRPARKMDDPITAEAVKRRLKKDHSPELIAGRLKLLPDAPKIGRQAIYNWIQEERQKGRMWHRYLPRRGRPYRRKQSGIARCRGGKPIDERPDIVERRERFGDWEGDTLEGRKGAEAVVPFVERKARFTILCPVKDRSAAALNEAVKKRFGGKRNLPRLTLTVDQGGEFRDGITLAKAFKADVFYADAHSPWQKGAVEQVNGLLRRYLPKGFDKARPETLALAEERLNHRPRKCLGFLTPHEVLFGVSPR